MAPKRRATDNTPDEIATFWAKYAPYWHVCSAVLVTIITVILWYGKVDEAIARTERNTADIENLQKDMFDMRGEVHGIALVLGVAKK